MMSVIAQIKAALEEAELYNAQGLLAEAHQRYRYIAGLIESSDRLKNREQLLAGLAKKIQRIDEQLAKIQAAAAKPVVSDQKQELIKNLFSFATDNEPQTAALEGAIALAKFGQYERAIKEFEDLLKVDALRIVAAKNIIRCQLAEGAVDEALGCYRQWMTEARFSFDQVEKIRLFFENLLAKKGITQEVPKAMPPLQQKPEQPAAVQKKVETGEGSEEILDINAIEISFSEGPLQGHRVEFDVTFQTGNVISILGRSEEKELIEALAPGTVINDIKFYSPIAIFSGFGVVSEKTLISSGPQRGHFNIDIKVEST